MRRFGSESFHRPRHVSPSSGDGRRRLQRHLSLAKIVPRHERREHLKNAPERARQARARQTRMSGPLFQRHPVRFFAALNCLLVGQIFLSAPFGNRLSEAVSKGPQGSWGKLPACPGRLLLNSNGQVGSSTHGFETVSRQNVRRSASYSMRPSREIVRAARVPSAVQGDLRNLRRSRRFLEMRSRRFYAKEIAEGLFPCPSAREIVRATGFLPVVRGSQRAGSLHADFRRSISPLGE